MKNITLGIVAHVDSGKTTLSEAILYKMGIIKEYGRVDNKDSFFDSNSMERERGITIFSKQANFTIDETYISLIDTPGHVDFSAEMERTLMVLDYAILVISGLDGIKGHTLTLWRLLKAYNIPVFIFVNKMDNPDVVKEELYSEIRSNLGEECVDFSNFSDDIMEEIAILSSDSAYPYIFDNFLDGNAPSRQDISFLINNRNLFPVFFGSALKQEGVDNLIAAIGEYTLSEEYGDEFGGLVFKITKDKQGNRLAHLKVTGGTLNIKAQLTENEKVNQIRIYSGDKFQAVNSVEAGKICTILGLSDIKAGDGIGFEMENTIPLIEPILSYTLECPEGLSGRLIYPKIKSLEEEFPELKVEWEENTESIYVKLMGEVQIEVLQEIIKDRFDFVPSFGTGNITYKETISGNSIGVGHFEPLRHYAEVHLLMEPGERGSGITMSSACSEDVLSKNWQRLIMTHIKERTHIGVLTGSELTDVHITLINGKAHNKHTEGGDFRQATYRAIRNGLMFNESVLLEPYYDFTLNIPSDMVGRAMMDIDSMKGTMEAPDIVGDKAIIKGRAPVATIRNYQINLNAYTHGTGSLSCTFCGYDTCHNQEEIINQYGYNPDEDISNPSSSVFCSHGAGVIVPWYEVPEYMHLQDDIFDNDTYNSSVDVSVYVKENFDYSIGLDEIDSILAKTYSANQSSKKREYKKKKPPEYHYSSSGRLSVKPQNKILIVDGYNVIFAWDELKELADININSAKDKLIQILSNYSGIYEGEIMLVFDGYKVKGNKGEEVITDNIKVIHTKEGQTADSYIEAYSQKNKDSYSITVASSDGLIQQITRGQNCFVLSSGELYQQINKALNELRENYNL